MYERETETGGGGGGGGDIGYVGCNAIVLTLTY